MVVTNRLLFLFSLFFLSIYASISSAAILPEERADALYHSYDGGGVTIDGPSVLLRKNVGEKFSFSGNYYVDMVTSASVDVLATASEYTEERTEYSFGVDYLNDRTIMSLSYTNSSESDYDANTIGFNISQEFFGDLSTLTMGFALGDDTVNATGADDFEAEAERKRISLGLSQILSKRFIASFSYEGVFDEGFLRNPYRLTRVANASDPRGYSYIQGNQTDAGGTTRTLCSGQEGGRQGGECYPETRNSEAFAVRGIYAFNERSSLRAEYRLYQDSWDIESNNIELRYSHQITDRWLAEFRTRTYQQSTGAFFYSDLLDLNEGIPEFYARDKELSEYSVQQFGLSISYKFKSRHEFFNNSTINFSWDHITFDYDNFSEVDNDLSDGESLYSLDADIIRIFYSAFF